MPCKKVLIVYQFCNSGAHKEAKAALKRLKISHKSLNRTKVHAGMIKGIDLILTVGGDGTFLRTSHFVKSDMPILGMNANIERKVGFFTRCDSSDIERKLRHFRDGKYKKRKLTRLRCVLNGKELPFLSLNEFFISHSIPWKLARYYINDEFQRSSGVLVGTASGSHAWLKSAGGRKQRLESKRFQYLVRELYEGVECCRKNLKGMLDAGDVLTIRSDMRNGIIVVDCLSKPYRMKKGDIAEFSVSPQKVQMIDF